MGETYAVKHPTEVGRYLGRYTTADELRWVPAALAALLPQDVAERLAEGRGGAVVDGGKYGRDLR